MVERRRVEAPRGGFYFISELKMAHFGAFWRLFFQLSCVYYFTYEWSP